MKIPIRHAFGALCALGMLSGTDLAHSESYPSKPVQIMVPYPPGGLVDIAGRVLGEKLSKASGQPMVIDNRPGASTIIGTEMVVKAKPDGYSLLLTTSTLTMNAALTPKLLRFSVLDDLVPIAIVATTSQILVVTPSLKAHSVKELIALAKSQPGKLTFASAGNGTPAHFAGEQLLTMTGIDVLHVAYKGAPPAMNAQIAGEISFQFANTAVAVPQIKAGKIRALAVASTKRSAMLPDVPTMKEAGIPLIADQWIGFFAPRGTPPGVIDHIVSALHDAIAFEDVKSVLAKSGMETVSSSTPKEFASYLNQDLAKYSRIVRDAHIKAD